MFTRRTAALSLLLLVPVALAAAAPAWASAVGLDVWNYPTLRAEVEQQVERERVFVAHDDDIRRRIEIKEVLVGDLIAGRTTLADVTAQFLALNRSQPAYLEALRSAYPGGTDEETTARSVLGFVTPRLSGESPERRAEVMTRLEVEFCNLAETHPTSTE